VQGQEGSHAVTVGEVLALRAYVAELAGPDEFAVAERLLGQLAALARHNEGAPDDAVVEFTPVPAAVELAARALEALRGEGRVRIGGRRWRLYVPRPSRASKIRFAPGNSPGDGAS
jgi:hypothetical protein